MLTDRERDTLLIRMEERLKNFEERMDDKLESIEGALSRDYKAIHGNGQPGLIERVREISAKCETLEGKLETLEETPARVQTLENYHENENSFVKKIGAVAAWIGTTALALYSIFKHH